MNDLFEEREAHLFYLVPSIIAGVLSAIFIYRVVSEFTGSEAYAKLFTILSVVWTGAGIVVGYCGHFFIYRLKEASNFLRRIYMMVVVTTTILSVIITYMTVFLSKVK